MTDYISLDEYHRLTKAASRAPRRAAQTALEPRSEPSAPLTATVPALPPSVNHLYRTVRRRTKGGAMVPLKFLTPAAERWYALAVPLIREAAGEWAVPSGPLAVTVQLYGLAANRDVDNTLKGILDALAQALGFDDKRIHRLTVERAGPAPRRTVVLVEARGLP